MIYNFNTHSFSYAPKDEPTFSLVLYTLELEYNLTTGNLIDISGYLPLVNAQNKEIILKPSINGVIHFDVLEEYHIEDGDAFDIFDKIPQVIENFAPQSIKYDKNKGIIQLGRELSELDKVVKINDNIFCGVSNVGILKCIYIIPDKFIYE